MTKLLSKIIRTGASAVLVAGLCAQASAAEISPAAEKEMARIGQFYDNLNSVRFDGVMKAEVSGQGQEMKFQVAHRKPGDYARYLFVDGKVQDALVINGQDLGYYFAPAKAWQKDTMTESFHDVLSYDSTSEMFLADILLGGDAHKGLLKDVTAASVSEKELDGEVKRVLSVSAEVEQVGQMNYELYFDAGDEPILRQVTGKSATVPLTMTITYDKWTINQELGDKFFGFDPPAGASENKQLRQMVGLIKTIQPGEEAPDFELVGTGGDKMKLSDLEGDKVVILDFWATWCGPCRDAMPILAEVAGEYADKGVVAYAVNVREDVKTIQGFMEKQSYSLPVKLDPNGEIGALYNVSGIPKTIIIDRDGEVQAIHSGFSREYGQTLRKQLDTLIAGDKLAMK